MISNSAPPIYIIGSDMTMLKRRAGLPAHLSQV